MNEPVISEVLANITHALVERHAAQIVDYRGHICPVIAGDTLVEALRMLRDEFQFDHLSGITGVDYFPQEEPRFHIIYFLHSYPHNLRLEIRVPVPGLQPLLPTIESIYPSANWYEREVWDMFGIRFEGNSDLRRILMPYEWEGHPLRKDYPLGYEEVRFTFNAGELERRKPSPKE